MGAVFTQDCIAAERGTNLPAKAIESVAAVYGAKSLSGQFVHVAKPGVIRIPAGGQQIRIAQRRFLGEDQDNSRVTIAAKDVDDFLVGLATNFVKAVPNKHHSGLGRYTCLSNRHHHHFELADIGIADKGHVWGQDPLALKFDGSIDGRILQIGAKIPQVLFADSLKALTNRLSLTQRVLNKHVVPEAQVLAETVERVIG